MRDLHVHLLGDERSSTSTTSIEDIVLDVEEYFWYLGSWNEEHSNTRNANNTNGGDDNSYYKEESGRRRRLRVENIPATPCNGCPDYSIMKFSGKVVYRVLLDEGDERSSILEHEDNVEESSSSLSLALTKTALQILQTSETSHVVPALHASPFETLWGVTSIHFGTNLNSATQAAQVDVSTSMLEEQNKHSLTSDGPNIIYIVTAACSVSFVFFVSTFACSYRKRRTAWNAVDGETYENQQIARNIMKLRRKQSIKPGAYVFDEETLAFERYLTAPSILFASPTPTADLTSCSSSSVQFSDEESSSDDNTNDRVRKTIDFSCYDTASIKAKRSAFINHSPQKFRTVEDILMDLELSQNSTCSSISPLPSPNYKPKTNKCSSSLENNKYERATVSSTTIIPNSREEDDSANASLFDYAFGSGQWKTLKENNNIYTFSKGKRVTFADELP